MRLEVFCEDRIGLTRELLDLLAARNIDLRGIEIDTIGRIYLNFNELDFEVFRQLMAEIRRISGVTDVRTVPFMPSEREHRAMWALLESLPEPVFSIDMKGKVELANQAALSLFATSEEKICHQTAATLIGGYNFMRWLEDDDVAPHSEKVVIRGQDYLMDIMPIYLDDSKQTHRTPVGAVVVLKSAVRMGRQLQNLAVNDNSEFDHIIGVSPKMRQLLEQARKLAMLDAPLLLVGETGTGKDVLARACHLRSPRGKKPFLALNCAALPDEVAESEL